MRITILGGGPAGLYFALLMKQQDPAHEVTSSSATGRTTRSAGASSSRIRPSTTCARATSRPIEAITSACETWDNVDVVHRGERITVRGNRFSGIARIRFLNILQERCRSSAWTCGSTSR
jgi:anthraniloyl-CoA monooxygenase